MPQRILAERICDQMGAKIERYATRNARSDWLAGLTMFLVQYAPPLIVIWSGSSNTIEVTELTINSRSW